MFMNIFWFIRRRMRKFNGCFELIAMNAGYGYTNPENDLLETWIIYGLHLQYTGRTSKLYYPIT